ncbi:MAG TPA: hypothetical protein PKO23_04795 [Candidatus Hydrogenedentes bacterium]|nr:hypothetical protein [Candidatus Hydrogenedentota bacterium]
MKYKGQIIGTLLLLMVFGIMFAVWQFHFKAIFDGYKEDERLRASLEETMSKLQETFQGYKPELLIEAWQNEIQPWRNAREERGVYFNFGDWYQIEVTPPEARMLKFWYTEESNKQVNDLYAKIWAKMGRYDLFPQDIRAKFDVATEERWEGKNVSWPIVEKNLRQLNFGIKLATMLLDANVSSVRDIVVWPRRYPEDYNGMLAMQTVGLQVTLPAKDMVGLLEKLEQESRYFTVDSLKVTYPYIAYAAEPQLEMQFLLTQANYRRPPDMKEPVTAAAAGDGGAAGAGARAPGRGRGQAPEGAMGKFWRWFRQTVLAMP